MAFALLLARLLLAFVFLIAGLAKMADRAGSRQSLRDFGVPSLLVTPFGLLLPLAELAVVVALAFTITVWWGVLGALALLLLFVIGIGYNLARGRQPECHCFGQLHSAPVGWPTLLRNLLLAMIASFVVVFDRTTPGPGFLDWLAVLTTAQRMEVLVGVLVLALLIGEGWMLLRVMTQQGRLLLRLEAVEARLANAGIAPLAAEVTEAALETAGLPVGEMAPTFSLSDLQGETLTLETLRTSGKPVILLFSDPDCGPCGALLPKVGRWQRDYASKLTLALISCGTSEANQSKARKHGITHVLLQKDREVAEMYEADGTPSAVLIRPDGTIGSPLALGAEAIRHLVASALSLPVLSTMPVVAVANRQGAAELV